MFALVWVFVLLQIDGAAATCRLDGYCVCLSTATFAGACDLQTYNLECFEGESDSCGTCGGCTNDGDDGSNAGAVGDPHLFGPHGDLYDFKGRNNTWYNFLSTAVLSISVLFQHDVYNWRNKVVDGSWMKAIAITAKTATNMSLKVAYFCDKPSSADIYVGSREKDTLKEGSERKIDELKLALSQKHILSFSNAEWSVAVINRYLPYHAKNGQKKRLDIKIHPVADVDATPVAPHGLVGQAYDRDDLKVIGKLDSYKVPGKLIVTTAMGEGAIEGTADDYIINGTNPFSTEFKFARFGLSFAAPRNVSSLTGDILPAMGSSKDSAGGVNDEAGN